MITGSLVWFWFVAGVSSVGSYFACRKPLSRFFYFLLAPVMFLMLWITIGAFVSFLPMTAAWASFVTSIITLGFYVATCAILYNDGPGGVALVEGLGKTGQGSRKGDGGDGGTTLPSPITYRRMSLK